MPTGKKDSLARIPKEVRALIAALQLRPPQPEALEELSESEWTELLSFCDRAHLTLPLYQLQNVGWPVWVRDRLSKNAADNAIRFERIKRAYIEIANALEGVHAKYLVLKGFAQYPGYVSSPQLRVQSDIDLYCPGDGIWRARSALLNIGYQSEETQDYSRADHIPSLVRKTDWEPRGNAFDPDMPVSVELHFNIWNETTSRISLPSLDRFWARRIMRLMEGFEFPGLSAVDNVGYTALHIVRNVIAGDWVIHNVYELANFLHQYASDREFWQNWHELHDDSLRQVEAIAYYLAKAWFNCDLPPEIEAEIDSFPPAILEWCQNLSSSPLEAMFRSNKDRLWLHLGLLRRSKDKLDVLRTVLVPTRVLKPGAPGTTTEFRRKKENLPTQRHLRYAHYLFSKVTNHACALPATLHHGFAWWLSQRKLGRQFWIFLAASFF